MDEKNLTKLIRKSTAIEKQLIGELYVTQDINDILTFTQTYISNYLPVLYYSIKNFNKNQIAKLMNSSILIDRLLSIRTNEIINFQVSTGVKEFLIENQIKDENSIVRLFNNLTTVNKASISSSLLFMFSLMRSALFSIYCNNKLYLNYGIGWKNLLLHFVENPHMIFLLENKDLELAEEQLDFIENDLSTVGGDLEKEVNSSLIENEICTEKNCSDVTKYFVGLKFEWLECKSLTLYCKFLKTNNQTYLQNSIKYANKIIETLESKDNSYHQFSFRDKLNTPGPSPNLKDLIVDLSQYDRIIKIFNYGAYFEKEKESFVIIFPTFLNFYFNYNLLKKENDIPLLDDEEFVLNMHHKECFGLLENFNLIVEPSNSAYYHQQKKYLSFLQEFDEKGLSKKFIYKQLRNSQIKDKIIATFDKKINKSKTLSNVIGITFISTFNYFAEAKGFPKIPAYVNTTVPLVTEIVMNTLYNSGYEKLILELTIEEENDEETNILGFKDDDEYESIDKLEKQIEFLETSSEELVDYINCKGLKDILAINQKIMSLIKSSKSVDEINEELHQLYITTKKNE